MHALEAAYCQLHEGLWAVVVPGRHSTGMDDLVRNIINTHRDMRRES
jgi:hypothetical protein